MLKGKTIIELKNIKTGEVERYEDHNMVTNALQHIFEPLGHYKKPDKLFTNSDVIPYYEKLLGGLLLFDGAIPENAEQIFAPASVRLTGCGVYGLQNDTVCEMRGDFNVTESEVNLNDKYVKYVYDFTTSQGNGVIASVALTSKAGGYCSYGAMDATVKGNNIAVSPTDNVINFMNTSYNCSRKGGSCSLGVTQFLFAVDAELDILYYLRINSAKSISIVKRRGFFKSIGVFDKPDTGGVLIETIDLPDMATGLLSNSYAYYNYNDSEGCLYIYSSRNNNSVDAGGTFMIQKVDLSNNTITEYTMTNQTNGSICVSSDSAYVYENFFYVRSYSSPYKIFKIAIGNSADVREIPMPSMVQHTYLVPCFAYDGWIFFDAFYHSNMVSTERAFALNTIDEDIMPLESHYIYGGIVSTYTTGVPLIGHPECVYMNGLIIYPGMYLATINNLDSPVTKTADKTMKVTYIIREHSA